MKKLAGELGAAVVDAAVELMGREGRTGTVRVQGRSMIPTFHEGQLLGIDFAPGTPRRGDLLLFRQQDYLVVHRFLGRTRFPDGRPSLRLRGDGVMGLDPHVAPSDVVGRVVTIAAVDGGAWSLRGPGPRAYAYAVAWHDLFWAAVGVVAGSLDRGLSRVTGRSRLRNFAGYVDQWLLRQAHRVLFRALHSRVAPDPPATTD